MTSRERVQAVLHGELPDSVPHGLYDVAIDMYNPSTIDLFSRKTGKHPRDCFRHDIRGIFPYRRVAQTEEEKRRRTERTKAARAIASASDIARTDFADAFLPIAWTAESIKPDVDKIHADGCAAMVLGSCTVLETATSLRGRE